MIGMTEAEARELAPEGSWWYAWGDHHQVVELTTKDGEPAVRLVRQDGAAEPPVITRFLVRRGMRTDLNGGGSTMSGQTLTKEAQASGKSRAAAPKKAEPKKQTPAKATTTPKATSSESKQISAREAAEKVLKKNGGPMRSKEIIAEAVKIAKHLKDPHAIQVALFSGAKKGKTFKNVEKGVYDLIDRG